MVCNVHDVISEMRKCCDANPRFDMVAQRDLASGKMLVTMFLRCKPISDQNNITRTLPYIEYSIGDGECFFYEMAWRLMMMQSFDSAT